MDAISPFSSKESVGRALRELAARQHGVFARAQALAIGATDAHLKHGVARGRYLRFGRGVFAITGVRETFEQRLMAACLPDLATTFVSHRSAAAIWAMPGIDGSFVEVTTTAARRSRTGARTHRVKWMPPCDVTTVDAIPVTTPTRTLVDLAAVMDEAAVEVALDDALRRGLSSIPRLRWRLGELGAKGRPGTKMIRKLLTQRPTGAPPESPLETKVVRAIRKAGLPEPRRQFRISDKGQTVARVDLAWPERRIVVEVDGYRYHSGRREWERDLARRNALESAGWKVVHITSQQLTANKAGFLRQLTALLDAQTSFFGEK